MGKVVVSWFGGKVIADDRTDEEKAAAVRLSQSGKPKATA